MEKLFCAVVDAEGSAFPVDTHTGQSVGDLKKAIKLKKPNTIKGDADTLRLFLAKTANGAWLKSKDLIRMRQGEIPNEVESDYMTEELKYATAEICSEFPSTPPSGTIHVLVKVPSGETITIEDSSNPEWKKELKYYMRQGEHIQLECGDYCAGILDKIDEHYNSKTSPLPFICVEGSSGMGKTQLAFALGGRRSWFYWPATALGSESQSLYRNFASISNHFNEFTRRDGPTERPEEDILSSMSAVYGREQLWTYGFIRALLEHCSLDEHQRARKMIRFEVKTTLILDKCDLAAVDAVRNKMEEDGKVLPFFVLDEMAPNSNTPGGMNWAAFQRNVFRVCSLVVIVMGTDAKITNLVGQSGGSYQERHKWVTVVSRFSPYRPITLDATSRQDVWDQLQQRFPVLKNIAAGSRGRFTRYFVNAVVDYATTCYSKHTSFNLCDLLDDAFGTVSGKTQRGNASWRSRQGGMRSLWRYRTPIQWTSFQPSNQRRRKG